ncbi:MAG TPA: hypothetical protein VFR02_08550, partial [bacterium]|nr:hypothetical protein [bacterium]
MFRDYFQQIKLAYTRPGRFFEQALQQGSLSQALRFSALTGVCVALELGVSEAFASSSLPIVGLVTALTLVALPLASVVWVFGWAAFIRLCGFLLQEDLASPSLRLMVGYSS